MSGAPATSSDPEQASANTAPAAAGSEVPQEAQSSSVAGGVVAQPAQGSRQQASKEAKEERPRPAWETAKDLEEYWKARKTFFTDEEHAEAWEETAKIVKNYSDELVYRWNKEIDTLLVFAGLFSAILTAFNVQSYLLLTPPPATDPVILALEKISAQLSSFSANPPSVNSTQPAFVHQDPIPTPATQWAIWLNALWFSSLIFSLAAASIGLMVKQWITEYNSGLSGKSRQNARLRQLRLESLKRWRVKEIVSVLPVLLQIASGLFFAGLLVLLWNLNRTVAIVGTVFVGFLALFSLSTIILPCFATHCSYLSPPSLVLFKLTRPWREALYYCRSRLSRWILDKWGRPPQTLAESLEQMFLASKAKYLLRKQPRIFHFYTLLLPRDAASTLAWRGMESTLVSRHADRLDGEIVATAYMTSMDTNYLRHAAACTTELTLSVMRTCFQTIRSASIAHWGEGKHTGAMHSAHCSMWSSALVAFMTASGEDTVWTPFEVAAALKAAKDYLNPYGQQVQSDASRTRLACVDIARVIQHCDDATPPLDCKDIAQKLLEDELPWIMEVTAETKLGNDVRQYVASRFAQEALKELRRNTINDNWTFTWIVRGMRHCVPLAGYSDSTLKDPEYQRWRSHLSDTFSRLLSTPQALEPKHAEHIDDELFGWLRKHGDSACLMSPELTRAIITYLETYETENGDFCKHSWYEFIEELNRKLAESSGKNATVAVMESTLKRKEGLLSVNAASLTVDDNLGRFCGALRCIIRCLPPLDSSDCKPDDPVYKDVRESAEHALRTFSDFLSTSGLKTDPYHFNRVFDDLCEHGERAGLMSPELMQAIITYLEAYETKHGYFYQDSWYALIEQLNRKPAASSGQNAAVDLMQSAIRRTKDPLAVDATSLTEGDNLQRFCHALRCIIRCIPPLGSSDCKPGDPIYKAAREMAEHALGRLSNVLLISGVENNPWDIIGVYDDLREHGERAGLITAELRHAVVRYRAVESIRFPSDKYAWFWRNNEKWIQRLKRELEHSEQRMAASNVASTFANTQDRTFPEATRAAVSGVADSSAAASQPAEDYREAHASTEEVDIQSSASPAPSSSSHVAPIVNGTSAGHVFGVAEGAHNTGHAY